MPTLIFLVVLPLLVIGAQIACGASGALGNSIYKLCFLIPPIVYCRVHDIDISGDIFKWRNWRHDMPLSLALGALTAAIFLGAYWAFGNVLLDKQVIASKIHDQFSVHAGTVLLIAPFTIAINSLVEEFFYRGFAFGLLTPKHRLVGTLLPAVAFTVQHALFIYHWVTPLPLALGIIALAVCALVLQFMYAKADSIVAPWLIHVCGDAAMMLIAMELVL